MPAILSPGVVYPLVGPGGTVGAPTYSFSAAPSSGMYLPGAGDLRLALSGSDFIRLTGSAMVVAAGNSLTFSDTGVNNTSGLRAVLVRDGNAILALKDGATSCEFRVYGTSTPFIAVKHDGTNGIIDPSAGILSLVPTAGSIAVGAIASVAQTGSIRILNGVDISGRNAANNADVSLIRVDNNSRVLLAPGGADIAWGRAAIALGGGSVPTLGTIGGSGPATAAQNAWLKVFDSAGNARYIPIWA